MWDDSKRWRYWIYPSNIPIYQRETIALSSVGIVEHKETCSHLQVSQDYLWLVQGRFLYKFIMHISSWERRCPSRSRTVSTAVLKAVTYILSLGRSQYSIGSSELTSSLADDASSPNVSLRATSIVLVFSGSWFFGERRTWRPNSPSFDGEVWGASSNDGRRVVWGGSVFSRLLGGVEGGEYGCMSLSVVSSIWDRGGEWQATRGIRVQDLPDQQKDLMPNNCIKLDVGLHSANLTDRCMKAIGQ